MFFVQKIHHVLMSYVSSPTVAVGTSIQRGHDNPACCKTKTKTDRYDCLKSGDELAACSQLFWRRRWFQTFVSSRLVSSLFFSSRRFNINDLISSLLLQTQCKFRIENEIKIKSKVLARARARARARANASLRVVSSVVCRSPDIIFIHVVSILLIIELTIVRHSQLRSVIYSF